MDIQHEINKIVDRAFSERDFMRILFAFAIQKNARIFDAWVIEVRQQRKIFSLCTSCTATEPDFHETTGCIDSFDDTGKKQLFVYALRDYISQIDISKYLN